MKINFKEELPNLFMWVAFGFVSYLAGARFSVNPFAFVGMFIIVICMNMREFTMGLRRGADISNAIWKSKMDEFFEKAHKQEYYVRDKS